MFRSFDPDESLRFSCCLDGLFYLSARAVSVVVSTDEKLWLRALWEKAVGVVSAFGMNGQAKTDQSFDAWVSATGTQADVRAKREAGEDDGFVQVSFDPVECGVGVGLLPLALVECALAEAYASEVEPEHGEPE